MDFWTSTTSWISYISRPSAGPHTHNPGAEYSIMVPAGAHREQQASLRDEEAHSLQRVSYKTTNTALSAFS